MKNPSVVTILRSFADYHEDLWPEHGIGTPQSAMRNAIDVIEQQQKIISMQTDYIVSLASRLEKEQLARAGK